MTASLNRLRRKAWARGALELPGWQVPGACGIIDRGAKARPSVTDRGAVTWQGAGRTAGKRHRTADHARCSPRQVVRNGRPERSRSSPRARQVLYTTALHESSGKIETQITSRAQNASVKRKLAPLQDNNLGERYFSGHVHSYGASSKF